MSKPVAEVPISRIRNKLFLLGLFKIPMIGFVKPKLVAIDDESVEVRIRLRRRTRNHLNSMYFGALAVGADIAAGIHVFYFGEKFNKRISFAFKSIHAEFIKRADTETTFLCEDGSKIWEVIEKAERTGERINEIVEVIALNSSKEEVARFRMGISVRIK